MCTSCRCREVVYTECTELDYVKVSGRAIVCTVSRQFRKWYTFCRSRSFALTAFANRSHRSVMLPFE